MRLTLDNEETGRLAKEVAELTGETVDEAGRVALLEPLDWLRGAAASATAERLLEIGRHYASSPIIDPMSPDEIVGYDETGMWR